MGGSRFQTLSDDFAHKGITIPANGSAATLLSLIGALALVDQMGNQLGDITTNLHRISAVVITNQGAAYQYGKTAATATLAVAATGDLAPPVTGKRLLDAFFQSTNATPVAAVAVVYFD